MVVPLCTDEPAFALSEKRTRPELVQRDLCVGKGEMCREVRVRTQCKGLDYLILARGVVTSNVDCKRFDF